MQKIDATSGGFVRAIDPVSLEMLRRARTAASVMPCSFVHSVSECPERADFGSLMQVTFPVSLFSPTTGLSVRSPNAAGLDTP